jgi:hypothetical protein
MHTTIPTFVGYAKAPWNKGRLIGQKRPLKPKDVWAIRVRLQLEDRKREIDDVCAGGGARERATVIQ